jgi:hypothetical protein
MTEKKCWQISSVIPNINSANHTFLFEQSNPVNETNNTETKIVV